MKTLEEIDEEERDSDDDDKDSSKPNSRLHQEENGDVNVDGVSSYRTIHKGRKYDWKTKINLHVHIIEHFYCDILEVVGFDTSTCVEAPRIFLSSSATLSRVDVQHSELLLTEVRKEFAKNNMIAPTEEVVHELLLKNAMVSYILERLFVSKTPLFKIEVKDNETSYRAPVGSRINEKRSVKNIEWIPEVKLPGQEGYVANLQATAAAAISVPAARLDSAVDGVATLTCQKPEHIAEVNIKRHGKSMSLVGEVVGEKNNKEEKLLAKLVSNHSSAAIPTISRNIMNRLSLFKKKSKAKSQNYRQFASFHKFRNDNDLLLESLSFIHVSDYILLQRVCKLWHKVLSDAMRSTNHLDITSRDFHNQEMRCIMPGGGKNQQGGNTELPTYVLKTAGEESPRSRMLRNVDPRFRWRDVFVDAETVMRLLAYPTRHLLSLKLHYVVLNPAIIKYMKKLNGYLKELSLGVLKFDDSVHTSKSDHTSRQASDVVAQRDKPGASEQNLETRADGGNRVGIPRLPKGGLSRRPSNRGAAPSSARHVNDPSAEKVMGASMESGKNVLNHKRAISSSSPSAATEGRGLEAENADAGEDEKNTRKTRRIPTSHLRYLHGHDVKSILAACGAGLLHLELSVTIGDIPPSAFKFCPKLTSFCATDCLISDSVTNSRRALEGYIDCQDLTRGMQGITMPDLLIMMSDSDKEAMMITDKKGQIVVVNQAWERLTGYTCLEVHGKTISILQGDLTDSDDFGRMLEAIKHQIGSESVTIFLHRPDASTFLAQIVFIPNVVKFRGLPLGPDALSMDKLGQMALDHQGNSNKGEDVYREQHGQLPSSHAEGEPTVNMKDWLLGMRELSYHFLRFGALCEPFEPLRSLHPHAY
mmetsp:Transcript_877/g.1351  ORF Transcript_877/g.1351 Transcript_877/m.1351 type:complete len:872 (+) Transcript_877:122-2737(+)|eukprot:CAMPEP_0175012854 /NCGR_PEP_ID=MMETSP0005-20121125/9560_1 /TAXON_ID=420556 /ORGANISM="Ochromonas sp., Strain CCMP1393" /LENGTH=871 /DNA_ID=CAMNT_0016269177 /DNA_START=104 /DNA_END=2719 /DNA_ORIENTATION=-